MALALIFMPGHIKREKERFSMVLEQTELVPSVFRGVSSLGPANPFDQDSFIGLVARSDLLQTDLHVRTNIRGTVLLVNTDVVFKGPNTDWDELVTRRALGKQTGIAGREFSWLRAIEGIASAIHMDARETMTLVGEENLARRMWVESVSPPSDVPEWISSDSTWHPSMPGKYIVKTCGDVMLSLYQLSQPGQFFLICHGASLIKAVSVADEHRQYWRILT